MNTRHNLEPRALMAVRAAQEGKQLAPADLLTVARCGWLSLVPADQLTVEAVMRDSKSMGGSVLEAAARTGRIHDIPSPIREKAWRASCGHPEITTAMICMRNGTLAAACANLEDFPEAPALGLDTNKTKGLEPMIHRLAAEQMASIGSTERRDTLMHHAAVHRRFDLLPQEMVNNEASWSVRNPGHMDSPLHVMLRNMVRRGERTLPPGLAIPPAAWHVENRYGETPLDIAHQIGMKPAAPSAPTPQSRLRHAYLSCGAMASPSSVRHTDADLHETFWLGGMTPQAQGRYWETWAASGRSIYERHIIEDGIQRLSQSQLTDIAFAAARAGFRAVPEKMWKRVSTERGTMGCPLHELIQCARGPQTYLAERLSQMCDLASWMTVAGGSATTLDLAIENGVAQFVPKEVRDKAAWGPFLGMLPGTPPEDIARISKINQRLDASLESAPVRRVAPEVPL